MLMNDDLGRRASSGPGLRNRCLITGQPLICSRCGGSLAGSGECLQDECPGNAWKPLGSRHRWWIEEDWR